MSAQIAICGTNIRLAVPCLQNKTTTTNSKGYPLYPSIHSLLKPDSTNDWLSASNRGTQSLPNVGAPSV